MWNSREKRFLLRHSGHTELSEIIRPASSKPPVTRCHIKRKVVDGEQVQCAAHGPGPYQGVLLPESGSNILRGELFHPRTQRQFSSRHHLRLNPGGARHHRDHIPHVQTWGETMSRQTPAMYLGPLECLHVHTLLFKNS